MSDLKPSEIVKELDKYIIGQDKAKKSVSIALRNRWRRQQVEGEIREEIMPNNIILGDTDISFQQLHEIPLPDEIRTELPLSNKLAQIKDERDQSFALSIVARAWVRLHHYSHAIELSKRTRSFDRLQN